MDEMTDEWKRAERAGRGLYRPEYKATPTDRHYRALSPLDPETCRCYPAGDYIDEDTGRVRCWKCGRSVETRPRTRGGTR